jgi:EAL domain-containing protein (putative c-di-GMP-specific phosphodiesterase class I)
MGNIDISNSAYNDMNKDSDYQNNIEWINKIKEAITGDRLTTYFQPIIDNKTGAITKYESLVRLIDKEGKVISPFFFLDIAKKAKLYTKITKIVIDKTFATFENLQQYDFSINITVEDINDEEISSYIFKKLKNYPNSNRVIFEITESEEIKDYAFVNNFIKTVKSYGAKIAIDDFGAGYANFEHIINLKADFIKIDGSLIKNINTDKNSRIITEAIIAFSKKLGSKTVVEFVHNEEVYKKVKELGADFSQGFHLGEPSPKIVSIKELVSKEDAPLETH